MAKLRFSEKNGEVCIHCKFVGSEMLNEAEYNYFIDNRIDGWLVPRSTAADKLEFTGARGIPLMHLLKSGVDTKKYFRIVSNLLNILEVAESCGFNMQNIVLDPDFITVSPESCDIHLFYLPLWYNESFNDGIVNCLRKISTYAKYADQNTYAHIDSFMNHVIGMRVFSIHQTKEYIRETCPEIFGQSYDHRQFSRPAQQEQPVRTPRVIPPVQHSGDTHQFNIPKPVKPHVSAVHKPEPKVLPSINEEKHRPLPELIKQKSPHTEVRYPTLTRRSTGVTVNISKPVFRIGKERDRVDFCVTENRTVSRVHATIYTRDGSCFIEDNNSTNKTYINGTPLLPEREIKLKSGDVLTLSNEEFDFTDA
ncbi:FHA domain-containing protein [Ruminococcus sp.]|uniref:FHA domain-containing protein n=1 Tax=Ruminococcus sp. TaxID=41978 RepID=UPI0025EE0305|nr:FHA domain-containing protein [Ruminococcus sp.]MCR4640346.1 FHA domain-containing protein [Ruminococcus sp.]